MHTLVRHQHTVDVLVLQGPYCEALAGNEADQSPSNTDQTHLIASNKSIRDKYIHTQSYKIYCPLATFTGRALITTRQTSKLISGDMAPTTTLILGETFL